MTRIDPGRRHLLLQAAAACWLAGTGSVALAHAGGPVLPPVALPAWQVTPASGPALALSALLRGQLTAVQLMFTGCSAVCPIQGAMYAEVQRHLADAPADWRLLSLSIDPVGDGPAQLRDWLTRFGAQDARWRAATPQVMAVEPLFEFLQGRGESGPDRHTAQVYVFDRQARLAFRTVDLPSVKEVLSALQQVALRAR